jgi:hypothetical protein
MSLAATKRLIFLIRPNRSNHCRPKRLKPEEESLMLGPQYVGTKKLYRSATGAMRNIEPKHAAR